MDCKKCWVCKESKPLDEFYRNITQPGGRAGECKSCNKLRNKKREKTPEGRNQPSKRKKWADGMFKQLRIKGSDY